MAQHRGWQIIGVIFLLQLLNSGIVTYCFTLWTMPWITEFGATRAQVMLAVMADTLLPGLIAPKLGHVLDRRSMRAVISVGCLLSSLGFFATSLSHSLWQLLTAFGILVGSGFALCGPMVAAVAAAKWFDAQRGLATGIVTAGTAAGGILMPPLVAFFIQSWGWRSAALIIACLYAFMIPLMWIFVRNSPSVGASDDGGFEMARGDINRSAADRLAARQILKDPGFLITALAIVMPTMAIYGVMQNLGPLTNEHGLPITSLSLLLSVLGALALCGKLLFGYLTDQIDVRYLYWFATALLATGLILVSFGGEHLPTMLLASGLLGFSSGAYLPIMTAVVAGRFGRAAFGQVMGLLYPFLTLCALGPVITGWLRDRIGTYDPIVYLYLIGLMPAALLMSRFPRRRAAVAVDAVLIGNR